MSQARARQLYVETVLEYIEELRAKTVDNPPVRLNADQL